MSLLLLAFPDHPTLKDFPAFLPSKPFPFFHNVPPVVPLVCLLVGVWWSKLGGVESGQSLGYQEALAMSSVLQELQSWGMGTPPPEPEVLRI